MMVRCCVAALAMLGMLGAAVAPADPFLWLEDVSSPRAMAWVKAENAKTLAVLQRDPRFAGADADALAVGQSHDRIPPPDIITGRVYNFWQDADHVRGIWRSTTIADYANSAPAWTTVLDLDALATAENKNWVWQGADCDSPSRDRCLISLSDGGGPVTLASGVSAPSEIAVANGTIYFADINNNSGPQTIEEGAAETIRLALLPDDGPTGTFSDSAGPEPW